jgi:hypothetical protein
MNKSKVKDEATGRIVAFLTRAEIDFIDSLAKDALFSTGHKLSRTDIIRAIIDCIKHNNIDAKGVSSKKELEHRLLCIMHVSLPASLHVIKEKRAANENL